MWTHRVPQLSTSSPSQVNGKLNHVKLFERLLFSGCKSSYLFLSLRNCLQVSEQGLCFDDENFHFVPVSHNKLLTVSSSSMVLS